MDPYWQRANGALGGHTPGDLAIVEADAVPQVEAIHRRLRRKAYVGRNRTDRVVLACQVWTVAVTAIACSSHVWMGWLFS